MRYSIEHVTHYRYAQSVGLSSQIGHLRPRDDDSQRCLSHTVEVSPAPDLQRDDRDYFGNHVTRFELSAPHTELIVRARSEVIVERPARALPDSPDWQDVRDLFAEPMWGDTEISRAGEFLFPSSFVPFLQTLLDFAEEDFAPERPILEACTLLMKRIHKEFIFDPDATQIATPIEQVLKIRRGVCQDFAHLMIGVLRARGLPARYVSGYLLTEPPPGKPRLEGADASHAWIAVFAPDLGWCEFDPTNAIVPAESHITLAWGRDFGDVSPLRGMILGGGEHEVSVAVTVRPLVTA